MIEGYVLHTIAYKDTSLIVKIFTKEYGIISLIANGAKRPKSQFFGILQPFIPLLLYWKHHHQDLALLHKAETNAAPYRLWGNYLFGALYINELLIRLLVPHEANIELFYDYQNFLININTASKLLKNNSLPDQLTLQKNLRFLEKKILKAIGYELQLHIESHTGIPIISTGYYYFDHEYGIKKYLGNQELPNYLISGSSLLALHNNALADPIELKEAKLFMRSILAQFLGDRPLKTKNLFINFNPNK